MAIRKFRSYMKPFIWFITIAFVLSTAIVGLTSFKSMHDRVNTYAFKLNGDKVSKIQVERTKAALNQNFSKFLGSSLDRDTVDMMAFDDVVSKKLTLEIAKELHVKVPSSEVNAQYEAIEKSIGNKEQFKRMLAAQGFTKKTLEDEIEENLLVEKTFEKISQSINPTDDEIKEDYNENKYTKYKGQSLDAVLGNVKEFIIKKKTMEQYLSLLQEKRQAATITEIADEYKKLIPQTVIDKDGIKVTNLDIAKKTLTNVGMNQDKAEAQKNAQEYYEKEIALLAKAKSEGININTKLPIDYQIAQYQEELYSKIINSINPTDAELKAYFDENSIKYDTFPSAKADIAILKIEPSDEDKAVAKEKAEKILKEVTPQNFAEKAKEYSEGPSASNGGELGWFGKGDMVEPFQKAVFEGEVGKVYPVPVETIFGYHIISVEGKDEKAGRAKASHILIIPKVSEKTLNAKLEDVNQLKTKLANGEVTFEDAGKNRVDVVQSGVFDVNNAGYISGLGYNENLANAILEAPLDKVEMEKVNNDKVYLFKKIEEQKYKKANFDDVKAQVLADYKNSMAQKEMQNFMN